MVQLVWGLLVLVIVYQYLVEDLTGFISTCIAIGRTD